MLLVSQRVEAPRMEPHIPLQGSIKRKLEDDSSPASSGVPDVIFPNDSKRLCLDDVNLAMGQGANPSVACPEMQSSPFSTSHSASSLGVAGHPVLLENNHMNGSGIGSPFSVPPNTEINQKGSIGGQNSNIVHYDEKGNSLQSMDQELQDLLEELTKMPDPSPNDLDLEKILCSKAEEPLGLSHSQPSISTTSKSSPQTSHLENHVANKDFSPGCNPTSGGSPQMRPSSAGANFQVPPSNKPAASPISTAAQSKNQPPPMLPVPLPNIPGSNWHAQQLKQLAASKQVSTTKQQVQAPSWPTMSPPGLSPPYRAGSSPHHQPFSPQNVMVSGMPANNLPGNNIQSPQNTLLSSMTSSSTPSNGPSPPYGSEKLSSPALNQQPFSPQSSMLPTLTAASLPANNIKSPQNNLVASMASTNTGPSPPYRPEKLSSPALHQQPFSPQESATQKMSPLTAGQGQQSLIHYLQQQQQQQPPPATQQSQQANNSQFLQQQFRQLMQPHRMQRHVQPATLPSQGRQDQNPGIVARLQEPGSIPSGGSVPAPATVNGYTMRNHLLKQQIMKRQLMQEKQRQNMLGVTSEQRSLFAAQQINQFQAVQQPIPTDCSQVMPAPPPNHRMLPSNPAMLQSSLGSGMAPATASQSSGTMVMIPHNPGKQQGIFPPNSDFNIPLRPSQNSLGMNSGCQTVHSHSAVRPGMPMAGFSSGSLANHSATQQHLRQPSMPRIPNVYPNSSAQMWTPTTVPRMPNQSQMDTSMQQFSGNALFSKQNVRASAPAQQFSQQAVVPPNQIAPGVQVRQMQKLSMGQAGQGLSSMSNQNLRHNLTRGPLPAMNVMKSVPQGVSSFNQLNPASGLGPPSYPSTGQPPDAFSRMSAAAELPQYDFVSQHSNSIMPANCSDTDFLDSLMKNSSSNDEEWLNNLTMIDDILGQHAQSSGHV
ncbi:mastermind-like domain-containing protein 1 isoform X2 [Falco rusticolus]|uniref:mastermind-like domain-containing protein 1 isoform X2 n=1 Tax=Falco rusticolus TaxID=120794 RepID=UPI00188689C4|nr:mastermind-like domain-containing protein 1 isoform X2 [Falco rusticolus]XP_055583481.1 mastermind-like domain-containing protein 1 isoform X2 [Falco cherrug]XP_055674124.1 mastermind-like domain-containing protein 1 isoform X2 [Falco peregrinus]